jgi:hypothetical protein
MSPQKIKWTKEVYGFKFEGEIVDCIGIECISSNNGKIKHIAVLFLIFVNSRVKQKRSCIWKHFCSLSF